MIDEKVQRLVQNLTAEGYESEYLERLRGRMSLASAIDSLEMEMRQEIAGSLGRAEDKINHCLLDLELLDRRLKALARTDAPSEERRDLVRRFNARRDDAVRYREYLYIQREALGFRMNDMLDRIYPIPARRKG